MNFIKNSKPKPAKQQEPKVDIPAKQEETKEENVNVE